MKNLYSFLFLFILMNNLTAQTITLKVWPKGAPEKNNPPGKEREWTNGFKRIENISEAEIYVYIPEKTKNTGVAIVLCPGGAYRLESVENEGSQIAEFLQENGIAGIVLKYRLPYGNSNIPLMDAQQTMRLVRSKADEWNIDPSKIGIAGSSAGGHLATTVGTIFDTGNPKAKDTIGKMSCRPDFMLLLYPVVTLNEEWGHGLSRINLLGEGNSREMIDKYSNELNVTAFTPPAFFVLADNDKGVPSRNSIEMYMAMKKYDIPAELHIFSKGGHGFGMKNTGLPISKWPFLFIDWLKSQQIIKS